jgi:hypothetical protein
LVSCVRASLVGSEVGWREPFRGLFPLTFCSSRDYRFAAEAGSGPHRRRRRRLGAEGEGEPHRPSFSDHEMLVVLCGLESGVVAVMWCDAMFTLSFLLP